MNKDSMSQDWQEKLFSEFSFLKPIGNNNAFEKWGFECAGGWYQLLRECFESIEIRYAVDGIRPDEIDFIPVQIKEKFGTLRLYYEYEDTPSGIIAIDILNTGESIRLEPKTVEDLDETKEQLRNDIQSIVQATEEKSRHTCEMCGDGGELRKDLRRIRTMCNSCYIKFKDSHS
jgi:hypothetical protein